MANNIILQTIKDVEFFNTRVFLEIFAKERQAYLILSKQKPFDIDSLKEYLIENNLNQFAKKEIIRLVEVIDYFLNLNIKSKEIPISNNFYHYKNDNNGGKIECSGWGTLFYILNINDRFIKTNENNFKEKHQSDLIFTFLTASRMSTKLNEIKYLFSDYLANKTISLEAIQQPENVIHDEVKKELYNHIFKSNAFEVFEKYHTTKSLAENSKTDLNLLFQLFINDNLFVETVELKHYIKWLNTKYNYSLIELKKVNINSKPNIQRANDYKEYKKLTLKQP